MKTYNNFADLRGEFNLPPLRTQTKNVDKLKEQRANFASRHICPTCKQTLSLVEGTNIMVCQNNSCKGVPVKTKDKETGLEKTVYLESFHTLDGKSSDIANNIFKEV